MNPVPASVGAPRSPQVNLLPPDVAERRAASRTRRVIVALVILFMVGVVGIWFFTFTLRQAAEQALADEQAITTQKQTELATYAYLTPLRAQVDNALLARAAAGQADVLWADQLNAFLGAFPESTKLDQLLVSPTTPMAPYTTDGTLFGGIDVGSVSFSGTSTEPLDITALQNAIDALPGFERSSIDSVSLAPEADAAGPLWSYSGTVRVTINALSGRVTTEQEIVPIEEDSQASGDAEAGSTDGSEG